MDGQELVKQTLDQIPQANANAKKFIGLVKKGSRITGYQLSDNSIVEKQQAVDMAKQGQIAGVGIAHRGDPEYLKSIPDDSENNNPGDLPSVSPQSQTTTTGVSNSGGLFFVLIIGFRKHVQRKDNKSSCHPERTKRVEGSWHRFHCKHRPNA